ncbi:MAG TPA: serine/threonine-protein kinase [Polyangiaceae bacterium]|nr:serine/threonine-protein kinase [Polyangiaceae bacterium]
MQEFEISLRGREGAVNEMPYSGDDSEANAPQEAALADERNSAEDRRIGQVIDGKYHVLRRLACGGMGSVYEARHTVVGRHVALKFLHEQYAQRSCMVQRFLREAQAAGSIASEHIIGVLDYGTVDGTPYLVMELVRGKDLREILTETPRLSPGRAVRIVLDACRGLALAHERGLIHRDLKPANICVTQGSDGREVAKVIDFGVAKLRDGAELSEEGTLIGTLGYMAPEQLTDQKELDARADIYALGVILYQALSGRPPHICNRSELLYRIVSVDPRSLTDLCPDLPLGLADVVHKALCRNKLRRYPNVRAFAAALEPFAREDLVSSPLLQAPTENLNRDALQLGRESLVEAQSAADAADLGNAPTWAALAPTTNTKADRQCDGVGLGRGSHGAVEEYCRHPDGLPLPAIPAPHHHLSQRALFLSVGALALSVVAMTTMFIFVYSHGSGALEAAAKASSRGAAKTMLAREAHPPAAGSIAAFGAAPPVLATAAGTLVERSPSGDHELGRPGANAEPPALAAASAEHCAVPGRPLHPASVLELSADGESGVSVQRHALTPNRSGGAYSSARAIECE